MKFLYQLSLYLYQLLIEVVSPFNLKARQFRDGRKQIFDRIKIAILGNEAPVVWFHCASLGEFEQARPVIELFKSKHTEYKVFLTFFSPSGYEIRKNYTGADWIFYLPIDTAHNAKLFVGLVKPQMAFFTKYEFWYFYLKTLHQCQIPVYSFSSIFRKKQVFFKFYGGFYRSFLKYFKHFFVQDEASKQLLNDININNVSVAGDTRFDRVAEICANKKNIPIAEKFKNNELCMVIGSSWLSDINILLPIINDNSIKLKYIIAPHEIHEVEIQNLIKSLTKKVVRFSEANEASISEFEILIIDNIGMLSSLYQYGDMAYVGGAFGKGLHNILEPATFGMPVFFGPKYAKFNEAVNLIAESGAFSVNNTLELEIIISKIVTDSTYRNQLATIAQNFVEKNTGGSEMIVKYVEKFNQTEDTRLKT